MIQDWQYETETDTWHYLCGPGEVYRTLSGVHIALYDGRNLGEFADEQDGLRAVEAACETAKLDKISSDEVDL